MERCAYDIVNSKCDGDGKENDIKKWTSLARQVLVCSSLWTIYFIPGLFVGTPPVYIAHTRREANSTEVINAEMASWLSSVFGYASIPWVVIIPLLTQKFGRKVSFYFVCISAFTSHILLYCSTTVTQFLISEIIASVTMGSHTTLMMQIIAEYTSPRYRGVFLTLKSASFYWGVWIGNIVGTFSHWRNIGLIGVVCCIYCGTALFWPESPYWLASKGRFQECSDAHYWLKGYNVESKKELEMIIKTNERCDSDTTLRNSPRGYRKVVSMFLTEEFYKPMLLTLTLYLMLYSSGKLVCNMYILEIVKEITANESDAYLTMLVLDGVTVFGMYFGCMLSKFVKRRTLLLTCSSIGILFLYTISLYLYLIKTQIIEENKIALLLLIIGFQLFVTIGPILLVTTIGAEIVPLKYNHVPSCLGGMIDKLTFGVTIKFSPTLFKVAGLHGGFLFFGATSTVFLLILFKYLPETKDKTLQEIVYMFKKQESHEIGLVDNK